MDPEETKTKFHLVLTLSFLLVHFIYLGRQTTATILRELYVFVEAALYRLAKHLVSVRLSEEACLRTALELFHLSLLQSLGWE